MKFISTSGASVSVSFREATYQGLAPDRGLFVPDTIPVIDNDFYNKISSLNIEEIAYELLQPYIGGDLNEKQLKEIIKQAFDFPLPLHRIGNTSVYSLELFHGPTWAFKDVGARFLAGCLSAWSPGEKKVTVLVATSGDTGGAVANSFYKKPGVEVVILYPAKKITPLQEQQIAGLGGNIKSIAIEGDFDDCQRLVKQAFNDPGLRDSIVLTSANSINIARWLPQMVFYAIAFKEIQHRGIENVICVPSGNYGNITSGMLLHQMGLKFSKFIAAHNENDTVPRFLQNGRYAPHKTKQTLANAMDVSDPGNFSRLQFVWKDDVTGLKRFFDAYSVSDQQILDSIRECWEENNYLLDPHTATAWHALKQSGGGGVILSTAHPAKFENAIVKSLGYYPEEWKKTWETVEIKKDVMRVDYGELREKLFPLSVNKT